MTITTLDALVGALGNNSSRILIDKSGISTASAGQYHSFWRQTGQPGQGAIPAGAAVPDHNTLGAIGFAQQTSPNTSYAAYMAAIGTIAPVAIEIHDRLMHMGGLSGIVTTAQTVDLDISANLATANLDARKGDANYSDVMWWMEWYTDTGGTVVTASVNVTYNDGTSGNLSAVSLAATRRASFMQPLNSFIPAADSGKFIRDINTVTLSATTGTAGSFGFTATRPRASMPIMVVNKSEVFDWASLGLPEVPNSSCLFAVVLASAANTGSVRVIGKIAHG